MFYKNNISNIYYEEYGNSNKSILILPGWGNTRSTFYNIINELKSNYKIFILDYPGFGNSPIPNKDLDIYDYTELIYKFIKYKSISNPIIIAHSFGGRITSILIGKYKYNVDRIILIDVAGIKRFKLCIFIKKYIYKLLKVLCNILPTRKSIYYKNKLLCLFSSNDYYNINPIMRNTFKNIINTDLKYYYKLINVDTLIIWGELDCDTPLKDAYYLSHIIPNSSLIVFKNSYHFPYITNYYQFIRIIYAFIS